MTVGEMKRRLEMLDDDLEVRIAHQPGYPFQYTVNDLVECAVFEEEDVEDDPGDSEAGDAGVPEDAERCVYVVEGSQVWNDPYLPYSVRAAIGWG